MAHISVHWCDRAGPMTPVHSTYYDDNDLNEINVPVGPCKRTYCKSSLKRSCMYKYLGVDSKRMGPLPEVLIAPHLNSTLNRGMQVQVPWWDITGEVVAYKPMPSSGYPCHREGPQDYISPTATSRPSKRRAPRPPRA
jgi:hypothetical protein